MITMITGGVRSGKSKMATSMVQENSPAVYLATAKAEDEEMLERIRIHKSMRPDSWRTFEGTYDLYQAVGSEKYYILDCLTMLTSSIMFDLTKDLEFINSSMQNQIVEHVVKQIGQLADEVTKNQAQLIIITNEVGLSLVPESHVGRVYRDVLGFVNQRVAQLSDRVIIMFSGLPLILK